MRLMMAAGAVALALVLFGLWVLTPVEPVSATYAQSDCRVVELIDVDTGHKIAGAEDMALEPNGENVIISAYDRFNPDDPKGGLYRISLWGLDGATWYEATNLVDRGTGVFRPHGFALSPSGDRLALINRIADGQAVIEIGDLHSDRWIPERTVSAPMLCRANDLDFLPTEAEALQITIDRADCGMSISDLMPGATTGRVAVWDGVQLQLAKYGLAFPNGISGLLIAETRKNRIFRPTATAIQLPGGPDNLTREDLRTVLVALHPSLRRLWLYLNGLWPWAPSRLARVNVISGAVEVLYDDPTGEQFPAATSAVFAKDMLIAGSVGAEGLLVCRRGGT